MNRRPGYSKEVPERAVRLVLTNEHDYSLVGRQPNQSLQKLAVRQTLRFWISKIEVDASGNAGVTSDHAE